MEDNKMLNPTQNNNDVIDIDLSAIKKKRFRIDHDDNKILELNTSDLLVINRLEEVYGKLKKLETKFIKFVDSMKATDIEDATDEENTLSQYSKNLSEIDNEMREYIDYIFNSNVSAICVDDGSMYDPIDGKFRYEHIIDKIMPLYENNFVSESKKIRARVDKATKKYTKK